MGVKSSIFREYDIRGIVGKDLNEEVLETLGKGIGTFLVKNSGKKIVVGCDNRETSKPFSKSLIDGLLSVGIDVTFMGLCTTPMVYFAVCNEKFDGGIMVTASHNPPEFNGLKITAKNAFPVFGPDLQKIKQIIEREKFEVGKGKLSKESFEKDYLEMLSKKIRLSKKKLKVVVDTGNGVAGLVVAKVLRKWGVNVIEMFSELDASFPNHLPDPTQIENVTDLIEKVKEENADLGLGFDGDCDRVGVVTSRELVFADRVLCLLAKDFLEKHPGERVLVDVKCSQAIEDVVEQNNGKLVWWNTGHSLIKSKMKKDNILFAGEMSGHIFLSDEFFGFDDGLYAAGRILRLLSSSDESLDELLNELPIYFNTPEIRLDCDEENVDFIINEVRKFFVEKYPKSIILDGIRIMFDEGWALVRKSNTQPKIILRFEAYSQNELERIKSEVFSKLRGFEELKDIQGIK